MSRSSSSTFKEYSWDVEPQSQALPWEEDVEDLVGSGAEDEDDSASSDSEDPPGEALLQFLLSQHASGQMNAKQISIISFYGEKAGIKELAGLGLPPDNKGTGDYKRKVDQYLRGTHHTTYLLPVPVFDKSKGARCIKKLHTLPIHEMVEKELKGLDAAALASQFKAPPNYKGNKIVQELHAKGMKVAPLSIFIDGVQISTRDSLVAVTVQNLWVGKQWLVAGIRKKLLCRCGCRGFCTLFGLFEWIRWSLKAMVAGVMPAQRHDGTEWTAEDAQRVPTKGAKMTHPAVQLRADWAELVQLVAAPTWKSSLHPCILCRATKANMWSLPKCGHQGLPWKPKAWTDMEAACQACEVQVRGLSKETWQKLTKELSANKALGGCCLKRPFPELKLTTGDRLEPSRSLPDWAMFLEEHHTEATFWRVSSETMVKHRVTMFGAEWCCTPEEVICLDAMHTLCLGVYAQYVVHSIWKFLAENRIGIQLQTKRQEEKHEANVVLLRNDLLAWYSEISKKSPSMVITRVSDLTLDAVGSKSKPVLHAKAHETLTLLRWLDDRWPSWESRVENGQHWRQGARHLLAVWQIFEKSPMVVPEQSMKE